VKVLVGFSAGGTTDILARLVAYELSRAWNQPVIVENKAGATGSIAAAQVAKARPDGYTLLMGSVSSLAINPSLSSLQYDSLKDHEAVTLVAHVPNMLVVNPRALPVTTFPQFIAVVKANPGKYFYASTGNGTASHLSAELLKMRAGLDLTHVPYKGAVGLNDVLAGDQVHLTFATMPSVMSHVKSGKLRALAVTSPARSAGALDVPTIAESGFPGFDASAWFGLVGPAGMPRALTHKIANEVARILTQREMREKFIQQGADPVGSTPEAFAEYLRSETAKWAKLVKAIGLKIE
jgi:tripartite-type tricarboxylate transporter receptor subunit TctC